MSGQSEQSLFFVTVPDLRKLCGVFLSCQSCSDGDEGEQRNTQVKTCRELLFLYSDIIASPLLDSNGEIIVIMALGLPQRVLPGTLQLCLSYSIKARLAPNWNRAGQYLIAGKDFLSDAGKLIGIVLDLSATETQLCVSVEASTVRLPPAVLEDFDVPPLVVKYFLSNKEAVLQNTVQNNWCYVLPSMKKGQIISISRKMPQECPFRSYTELQKHWMSMYGYHLPPLNEDEVVYCSVYFKLLDKKLFTYPLSCIRTQPVQCFPRVDLQGALGSFMSDLRRQFEIICGFPARMTSKPCYHTTKLTRPHSQGSGVLPANLTTKTSSRLVLTQLPSSCPPGMLNWSQRPVSQPGGLSSLSQTTRTREQGTVQTPSPGLKSSYQHGVDTRQLSSAGASLLPRCSPAALVSAVQPSEGRSQPAFPVPKLVPIFKNRSLSRHVNVTKILAEKQQKKEEVQNQHACRHGVKRSHPASCSPSSPCAPSTILPPSSGSALHRVSLPFFKGRKGDSDVGMSTQQPPHHTPSLVTPEVPRNRGGDVFTSHPKRPKVAIQDVDIVKYAKSNQLAKINMATLQAWLRSQGVSVRSKDKKEELVSKVMHCLCEP
ncbi:uncharacterized protein C18orf63 homolog isoform X2 [Brachyhypopomus gauderio]|uniref:uncharacterized protein C18orf63 homolog isoform X2 n=1 Tax=Brachyhypopomus gauderio TaxID=698409 RepID=UPI00404286DA